jgi:hypothetical protein
MAQLMIGALRPLAHRQARIFSEVVSRVIISSPFPLTRSA